MDSQLRGKGVSAAVPASRPAQELRRVSRSALSGSLVVRREMLFAECKQGPLMLPGRLQAAAFGATDGCLARGPQTNGYDASLVAVIIGV